MFDLGMKISVITVAYNSGTTLGYTIESFLAQTHKDAELVIIDGASSDDTLDIPKGYDDPRIRVHSAPDQGIYDAMNKGLRHYRGDAVGFLNADDRYHDRHALARVAEGLRGHDIVYGNLDFVTDHLAGTIVRQWRGTPYEPGGFRRGWMPAHPTFYARRAVVERTGLFDTGFKIAADYDFMLRALEIGGASSMHIDAVLVDMMAGGRSTRNWMAYVAGNLESLKSRRRWLGSGVLDYALMAKPARKLGQWLSAARLAGSATRVRTGQAEP